MVAGLDDSEDLPFNAVSLGGTSIEVDVDRLRDDVVDAVLEAIKADASIGAVLLECASLQLFAADINQATGLPVFDYNVYIDMLYRAVVPKRYQGFL